MSEKNEPAFVRAQQAAMRAASSAAHKEAWERWITSQLRACSLDELRVIGVRLSRLARARAKYGPLNLSADPRNFRREAAEENVDRAFYLDCLLIARQDENGEGLFCVAVDEPSSAVEAALRELRDAQPLMPHPCVDLEPDGGAPL